MVVPGTIFEEFGFNYVGPIDGHDLDALIPTLENLREARPAVPAHHHEGRARAISWPRPTPSNYHAAAGKFDPLWVSSSRQRPQAELHPGVWGLALRHGRQDQRLVGITPMREGSGMVEFHKRFPERYYDVGIAEQHRSPSRPAWPVRA